MSKFKVGEIVIIQSKSHPEYNGMETEIIEILARRVGGYRCTIEPEYTFMQNGWAESALRKRRPPQETSTWEEVQEITKWNPSKEVNHAQ